jgi:tetratricopeptide (TPR) repeat protein
LQHFGTAEVSRLTDIPMRSVRAMVRARYVIPGRGPRGSLQFSFQDLVLLRTARDLLAARMSPRRVGAALRAIRSKLPADSPASGLSVTAAGDRVVVHQEGEKHEALSGQLLLALEVRVDGNSIQFIDASRPQPDVDGRTGEDCARSFEAALALEDSDIDAAAEAYRTCVTLHAHAGAVANLGRLLHLRGRISEAVQLYRAAQPDADILFNLGVALEDLGRAQEAIEVYSRVIDLDRSYGDAHHNIARLYQETGEQRLALRHWNAYRRLSRLSTD